MTYSLKPPFARRRAESSYQHFPQFTSIDLSRLEVRVFTNILLLDLNLNCMELQMQHITLLFAFSQYLTLNLTRWTFKTTLNADRAAQPAASTTSHVSVEYFACARGCGGAAAAAAAAPMCWMAMQFAPTPSLAGLCWLQYDKLNRRWR